jgi:uncharacterized protein (DUF924 family)
MSDPVEVLDYWIGEVGEDGWFAGGSDLDAEIRDRFGEIWQAAADGGLEHWVEGAVATLAYLIVTDQMPRNIHRGRALAFATDAQALAAARKAIDEGWDMSVPEPERMFFYLPFEHSENPADQARSVRLVEERLPLDPEMLLHARAHQMVIARFGRFPFRNVALGRTSTPDEEEFMAKGGYGAMVEAVRASHANDA